MTELEALTDIDNNEILSVVAALKYFETYGREVTSYIKFKVRSMHYYRERMRTVDKENYIYKLALNWSAVYQACIVKPSEEMFNVIRDSIKDGLNHEEGLKEDLIKDLAVAKTSCEVSKRLT